MSENSLTLMENFLSQMHSTTISIERHIRWANEYLDGDIKTSEKEQHESYIYTLHSILSDHVEHISQMRELIKNSSPVHNWRFHNV